MATLNAATAEFDFADQIALISSELLRFRMKSKTRLTPGERTNLEKLEMDLDKATAKVRSKGIAALGSLTKKARTEVEEASKEAEIFLKKIKKIEKVIDVITSILSLGLAITSGGTPLAILNAAKAVKIASTSDNG